MKGEEGAMRSTATDAERLINLTRTKLPSVRTIYVWILNLDLSTRFNPTVKQTANFNFFRFAGA